MEYLNKSEILEPKEMVNSFYKFYFLDENMCFDLFQVFEQQILEYNLSLSRSFFNQILIFAPPLYPVLVYNTLRDTLVNHFGILLFTFIPFKDIINS